MKVKLLAVLIAVTVVFIGTVIWRTDSFVYGDRMSWVEAQTRTQLGAIDHSVSVELKSLQRLITSFTSDNFRKDKINWNSFSPYYAVASFTVNGSELQPQTLIVKDNSKASNWNIEFVKSALGKISDRSLDIRYYVKSFQDANHGRYVALLFVEGTRAYALFGSGEMFQSLIDAQKGSLSSFSIVTNSGLTVGHSIPEYVGTVMRDDPFFKDAQKNNAAHGGGVFKLPDGQELYGMYDQVPQSNLLIISSAPLKEAMKGRGGLWWQFLLMGGGLALVGLAGILWVVNPAEKKMEALEEELSEALAHGVPAAPVEKSVSMDAVEMSQQDRMQSSMRVASALAHEMRGPLTSIIGYSQMILSKTPEGDIVNSTDSILRETRSARSVLDKLLGFAGEEVKEKNLMKVEGPLAKALKVADPLFQQKGVKIIREFQETSPIELHTDALIKALDHIFTNAVEAMERMPKKEIRVQLFEDPAGTHLIIEDTGEGIEPGNLEKIFDPFFTTRSFQNHMGLGLAVAFGVFKEHNAEIQVSSERGRGTQMSILFKKYESVPVLKAPEDLVEEVVIARELPSLKEKSAARREAEEEFADTQSGLPPVSPLDMNIEKLLDFPEAIVSMQTSIQTPVEEAKSQADSEKPAVVKTPEPVLKAPTKPIPPPPKAAAPIPAPPQAAASIPAPPAAKPATKPVPPPPPKNNSGGDDELMFIDGFLGDVPKAPTKAPPKAPPPPPTDDDATVAISPGQGPTGAELTNMDDDFVPATFINPPQMNTKNQSTKLDSYRVEVRKPGKRI